MEMTADQLVQAISHAKDRLRQLKELEAPPLVISVEVRALQTYEAKLQQLRGEK